MLHGGESAPNIMMPLPDPTFFPNRFDDITPRGTGVTCLNTTAVDGSADCTLREAILKANGDTIMLQAGTYTLSLPKVANDFTGNHGALYVNKSVTIVGAGQNSTFIQAGTVAYNAGTANGVDLVIAVNEDINPLTNASASISNLTIQNGHNRGTHGNDGDGGCMEFDTGTSGTATLSLTNVTLQNCDTVQGNGGGLASFNFLVNGPGMPTITNSIIQGNKGADSVGGRFHGWWHLGIGSLADADEQQPGDEQYGSHWCRAWWRYQCFVQRVRFPPNHHPFEHHLRQYCQRVGWRNLCHCKSAS